MKTFKEVANEVADLVTEKNKAYGSSFLKSENFIRDLWPNGIPVESYGDMLAMIRIVDKFFRIATNKDAFGEDPWRDVNGYSLLRTTYNTAAEKKTDG